MVNCCVPLCTNHECNGKPLSYHEFPSNFELRAKWLLNISRIDHYGKDWMPSDRSHVCCEHFEQNCFKEGKTRRILIRGSIPTLFPKYPSYLQDAANVGTSKRLQLADRLQFILAKTPKTPVESTQSAPTRDSGERVEDSSALAPISPPSPSLQEAGSSNEPDVNPRRPTVPKAGRRELRNKLRRLNRIKNKFVALQDIVKELRKKVETQDQSLEPYCRLTEDAKAGIPRAIVLLHQINTYGNKKTKYPEEVIWYCNLWRARSLNGYEHLRQNELLKLPSRQSLNYAAPTPTEPASA